MAKLNNIRIAVVILAVLSILVPIFVSIVISERDASARQESFTRDLARTALMATERTSDQLETAARAVNALPAIPLCSPRAIAILRNIDLSSTLLQAAGRLDGHTLACGSVELTARIELGPPDFISTNDTMFWDRIQFPGSPLTYLGVGKGTFLGIVHKELPLSFIDLPHGASVIALSASSRRLLVARGRIDPAWLQMDLRDGDVVHVGHYLVSVARSSRYDLMSLAAVPDASIATTTRTTALVLVPIGCVFGIVLSILLSRLVHHRTSMPAMILAALRAGEFELNYQPVIALDSGRVVGAEALVRMRRPGGDIIGPDCFIPVAEQTGSIHQITSRVFELAAADMRAIKRICPEFHLSVNFSACDVHCPKAAERVLEFAAKSGLPLKDLIIEITERSFVDIPLARRTIQSLRELGVRIAIDDFGTGYSSLGHLAQLEIDYLKIDKTFVHALGSHSATSHVTDKIVEMANGLNIALVAEGVETERQACLLRAMNVELAQGYHFGCPMAPEDFLQYLRGHRVIASLKPQGTGPEWPARFGSILNPAATE